MTTSGLLLGMALALTVTAAQAEDKSANYMLPHCQNFIDHKSGDLFGQGLCAGLVEGVTATVSIVALYAFPRPPFISPDRPPPDRLPRTLCIDVPNGVTIEQLVRVVVAYVEARPDLMHQEFRLLSIDAVRAAWPCK
jgi:Rap1a immunity proteins